MNFNYLPAPPIAGRHVLSIVRTFKRTCLA
jgi:hypothetical protein